MKSSPLNYTDSSGHAWDYNYVTGEYDEPDELYLPDYEEQLRPYMDVYGTVGGRTLQARISDFADSTSDKIAKAHMNYLTDMLEMASEHMQAVKCEYL